MTQPFRGEVLTLWAAPAGLDVVCTPGRPASLVGRHAGQVEFADPAAQPVQPLVEILAVGHGHGSANLRHTATAIGARLRVTDVGIDDRPDGRVVRIEQRDDATGLVVEVTLDVRGRSARATTLVRNGGTHPVHLQAVTSLAVGAPLGDTDLAEIVSVEGTSDWLGESRWRSSAVRAQDGLVDLDLPLHQHQDARGARSIVSHGSWSTGERIPTGVLTSRDGGVERGLAGRAQRSVEGRARRTARSDDRPCWPCSCSARRTPTTSGCARSSRATSSSRSR